MAKVEYHICDIHGCQNRAEIKNQPMQVVFTTEQTEGTLIEPYLLNVSLDLCGECLEKIVSERRYIEGAGAQGHNVYSL